MSIHALARILPKLGGGTATGVQGDAAGHARGDAAPNGAEGARSGQEELYRTAPPQTGRGPTIALATLDGDEVINCAVRGAVDDRQLRKYVA